MIDISIHQLNSLITVLGDFVYMQILFVNLHLFIKHNEKVLKIILQSKITTKNRIYLIQKKSKNANYSLHANRHSQFDWLNWCYNNIGFRSSSHFTHNFTIAFLTKWYIHVDSRSNAEFYSEKKASFYVELTKENVRKLWLMPYIQFSGSFITVNISIIIQTIDR